MFEKILAPTDGSPASLAAAGTAARVAAAHGGTIHPLVAVEYRYIEDDEIPAEVSAAVRARIDRRAREALQEVCRAALDRGAPCTPGKIAVGTAAQAILDEAEAGGFDLIVMGSRGVGREANRRRLVGSVTEQVLAAAPCPVLVIREE